MTETESHTQPETGPLAVSAPDREGYWPQAITIALFVVIGAAGLLLLLFARH
ncbi:MULTISPECIES: hypothetical protein [Subtercola]|uniref:hypothetical protein n=1 Tax=Subtercola TaxID=120212 RepID=UPI0013757755|nr:MULTISPECIES: hypothetical protein [Subtercola]MEA9986411.1 hypothetical protein [Subtercola sp. RTI3]